MDDASLDRFVRTIRRFACHYCLGAVCDFRWAISDSGQIRTLPEQYCNASAALLGNTLWVLIVPYLRHYHLR